MTNEIAKAVEVFNQGGIVIFPTDTAFGIGCRMDNESVVKRLFTLRKRPVSQAVSVLVSSISMAQKYLMPLTSEVMEIMQKHWPGGLTIVYPCRKELVLPLIRAKGETLGVRMPDHYELLQVIETVGMPVLGPSANFHGLPTPFMIENLNPELVEQVDYVLEGFCSGDQASTVLDCSVKPWKIIRQGAVALQL